MKKATLIKMTNKSNLVAASNYLIDKEHKQHIDTFIDTQLNWKSELLNHISWNDIDNFEACQKAGRDHSKGERHGKELIVMLPDIDEKLISISENKINLDYERVKNYKNEILNIAFDSLNINPEKTAWEMQFHLSKRDDGGWSPHFHLLIHDREITFEPVQKRYKKDQWRDPETGKLAKAGKGILEHKKGDLMFDKEGAPLYENGAGASFSAKNREINLKRNLKIVKEQCRKLFQRENPEHLFYTGKDPERIQGFKYTKAMEKAHPEKATLIKQVNKNIRLINEEIEKVEEPMRRRAFKAEAQEKINNKKEEIKFKAIDKQMELLNQVIDFTRDFQNRVIDFLNRAKEKITWWTQFNIYNEPNAIYKKEDKGKLFGLYEFNLRENGVKFLGEFNKTDDEKKDIVKAAGFEPEYEYLFEETKASELNRVDGFIEIEPKMTTERQIERSRGMRF